LTLQLLQRLAGSSWLFIGEVSGENDGFNGENGGFNAENGDFDWESGDFCGFLW
jgi:hypothetical protein